MKNSNRFGFLSSIAAAFASLGRAMVESDGSVAGMTQSFRSVGRNIKESPHGGAFGGKGRRRKGNVWRHFNGFNKRRASPC